MKDSSKKIEELELEVSRLKNSVQELKLLNDIAVSASKETDVDLMLNMIVKKSIKALDAEQSLILLVTKNSKDPFKTIIKQDDRSSLKHSYHVGENITGWVLLNREALINVEDWLRKFINGYPDGAIFNIGELAKQSRDFGKIFPDGNLEGLKHIVGKLEGEGLMLLTEKNKFKIVKKSD